MAYRFRIFSEIWIVCHVRFSDFLVNEIDASGRVVRLTSLDASSSVVQQSSVQPKLPAIPESAETADEKPPAQTSAGAAEAPDTSSSVTETYPSKPDWEETVKGFADVLPAESYSAVLSFYQTIAAFEAARSGTALPQTDELPYLLLELAGPSKDLIPILCSLLRI